jgi:hypothetical protein
MSGGPIERIHLLGADAPRPPSNRTIYADGSADADFRPGVDVELSHWVPSTTPARWAADSSTEICVRFVADQPDEHYDLAVNNHADVDGILSLFVLTHGDLALAHRDTIVGAAEMGDFWAAGDRPAFRLFQEIVLTVGRASAAGWELADLYSAAFDVAVGVLTDGHPEPEAVATGWQVLEGGRARIDTGEVAVETFGERLVSYRLPRLDTEGLASALVVAPFNVPVDDAVWLWPHTRNRDHGQHAQVVSVDTADGWLHDLWLPGYSWAYTPDRWPVPGLVSTGDSNAWLVDDPELDDAVARLQGLERADGRWRVADQLTPFTCLEGRGFPVVAAFVDDTGTPAASSLDPDTVAAAFAPAFSDGRAPQSMRATVANEQ